ncbi:MAG TPA: DUF692 family protein [Kofleriaceae bacterium]|nr:DUF692 family protein [Kofleriaceae bacterium]
MITLSVGALAELGESTAALRAAGLGDRVSAIEILWDNYCSLDPVRLADDLATVADRVMLHVMWSRYLELDRVELDDYLARLRRHVDALRPIAVSDHLCRFQLGGAFVGAGQERTYDDLEHVCERVARYQDAIGTQLLVENTASSEHPASVQVEFVEAVMARTGCGLLFDISNAVVGELNGLGPIEVWLPLVTGKPVRCHVGSYTHDLEVDRYIDTHATAVSRATETAIAVVARAARIDSITYERDHDRTIDGIAHDLRRIGACACA